jgi:hypothetical protein
LEFDRGNRTYFGEEKISSRTSSVVIWRKSARRVDGSATGEGMWGWMDGSTCECDFIRSYLGSGFIVLFNNFLSVQVNLETSFYDFYYNNCYFEWKNCSIYSSKNDYDQVKKRFFDPLLGRPGSS